MEYGRTLRWCSACSFLQLGIRKVQKRHPVLCKMCFHHARHNTGWFSCRFSQRYRCEALWADAEILSEYHFKLVQRLSQAPPVLLLQILCCTGNPLMRMRLLCINIHIVPLVRKQLFFRGVSDYVAEVYIIKSI